MTEDALVDVTTHVMVLVEEDVPAVEEIVAKVVQDVKAVAICRAQVVAGIAQVVLDINHLKKLES